MRLRSFSILEITEAFGFQKLYSTRCFFCLQLHLSQPLFTGSNITRVYCIQIDRFPIASYGIAAAVMAITMYSAAQTKIGTAVAVLAYVATIALMILRIIQSGLEGRRKQDFSPHNPIATDGNTVASCPVR
jgi:hypothetical protein